MQTIIWGLSAACDRSIGPLQRTMTRKTYCLKKVFGRCLNVNSYRRDKHVCTALEPIVPLRSGTSALRAEPAYMGLRGYRYHGSAGSEPRGLLESSAVQPVPRRARKVTQRSRTTQALLYASQWPRFRSCREAPASRQLLCILLEVAAGNRPLSCRRMPALAAAFRRG